MSLSDKKQLDREIPRLFYWEEDVAEAVKELKEALWTQRYTLQNEAVIKNQQVKIIKEIFGEKLIK